MSKARDIADLGAVTSRLDTVGASDGALSNRNVIINGSFDVWQRSVGPVTGAGYTTVDRWRFPASGITSEQVSNDRDVSIPYALKVTADGTGYGIAQTRIEDARTLAGKQATFSIWVKSPTTGSFRFFIEQNFGSGGSSTVSILDNASQFSIASANTWEQFTVTVTMPSVSGKTLGAGHHVSLGIGSNSGTANRVMYYSEVQLEVGDTATPFEHRSYGDELARCQRYYQKSFNQSVEPGTAADIGGIHLIAWGDGNAIGLNLPVTMRAAGTWTLWPTNSTNSGKVSSFNIERVASVIYPSERGYSFLSITSGTANEYVRFQYAVDAEL